MLYTSLILAKIKALIVNNVYMIEKCGLTIFFLKSLF